MQRIDGNDLASAVDWKSRTQDCHFVREGGKAQGLATAKPVSDLC